MTAALAEKLDRVHAQVLVVDVQGALVPQIIDAEPMLAACTKLLNATREMHLPITISEQNPSALGRTHSALLDAAGDDAHHVAKMTFSVCADRAAREKLLSLMRPQVILIGIEAHVCVQQTALGLLQMQMRPFVLADAVSSRRTMDRDVAFARLRAAGAIVTTAESAIFELLHEAGTELFRRILPIVK